MENWEQIKNEINEGSQERLNDMIDNLDGFGDVSAISTVDIEYSKEKIREISRRRVKLNQERIDAEKLVKERKKQVNDIDRELYSLLSAVLQPGEPESVLVDEKVFEVKLDPNTTYYLEKNQDYEVAKFFKRFGYESVLTVHFQTLQKLCKEIEAEGHKLPDYINKSVVDQVSFSRGKKVKV